MGNNQMNTEKIQIEKGIPIPDRGTGFTATMKKMEVGDSIIVVGKSNSTIHTVARNIGIKIAIRTVSETELRVWRTA